MSPAILGASAWPSSHPEHSFSGDRGNDRQRCRDAEGKGWAWEWALLDSQQILSDADPSGNRNRSCRASKVVHKADRSFFYACFSKLKYQLYIRCVSCFAYSTLLCRHFLILLTLLRITINSCIISHCEGVILFFNPFSCDCAFRVFSGFCYYKYCCDEHLYALIFFLCEMRFNSFRLAGYFYFLLIY